MWRGGCHSIPEVSPIFAHCLLRAVLVRLPLVVPTFIRSFRGFEQSQGSRGDSTYENTALWVNLQYVYVYVLREKERHLILSVFHQ